MSGPVLLLTVGAGDPDRLEETLLAPLRRSIREGSPGRVVLVPSSRTAPVAGRLAGEVNAEAHPLPPNAENDFSASYAHFDALIEKLRRYDNTAPADLIVDFTRGTKVMGIAAALAAVRHGARTLRYVRGDRDDRGAVRAGTETIHDFDADAVHAAWREEAAALLSAMGWTDAARYLAAQPRPEHPA